MDETEKFQSDITAKPINNAAISSNFLNDIKFWRNRIKYDSKFKYSFFILYLIYWVYSILFFNTFEYYIKANLYIIDLYLIIMVIFALVIAKKVPNSFEELINNNKKIFKSEENFTEYKNFVRKVFNSKIEFYVPLVFGLLYAFIGFYLNGISTNFEYAVYGKKIIYFESELRIMFMISLMLRSLLWLIRLTIIVSGITIIMFTFKSLRKILKEQFFLLKKGCMYFTDVRNGAFNKLIQSLFRGLLLILLIGALSFYYYLVILNDYLCAFIFLSIDAIIMLIISIYGRSWAG